MAQRPTLIYYWQLEAHTFIARDEQVKDQRSIVLLIAHGSRLSEANEEVLALAKLLAARSKQEVIPCFLEIAAPDIPTGIDLALQHHPKTMLILPYFLTQGRHVKEDLPKIIAAKASAYPETRFKIADYLGSQHALVDLLATIIEENG